MSFTNLKAKSFEEADKDKLVKLLNLVHVKINGLNGKEAFEYFRLLSWAQQTLLPKIADHVLGDPIVHEAPENDEAEKQDS